MSRFFSPRFAALEAYVPGEQPLDTEYLKLNTNESPYPPSPRVTAQATEQSRLLNLYSDPACRLLKEKAAALYGVAPENVLPTNGSDDILNFAFMAFCDENTPAVLPDISYGFYPVLCQLNRVPSVQIPLHEDLSIDPRAYHNAPGTVVIANPNAPTGLTLSRDEIEGIVAANPEHVVVIDEAYVDFGGESCVPLTKRYANLLVTQTFSKSRSLAGGRIGFGIGDAALIADLNALKYSTNPYSINRMSLMAAVAAIEDNNYYMDNCRTLAATRDDAARQLRERGFTVTESRTNFLFARHPSIGGEALYQALKARGILVRWFNSPRIVDYLRITVGTPAQMTRLIKTLDEIGDLR